MSITNDTTNDTDSTLTYTEVDRNDVEARVAHFDHVAQLGCDHEAIRWNGSVQLVSCPACARPDQTSPRT